MRGGGSGRWGQEGFQKALRHCDEFLLRCEATWDWEMNETDMHLLCFADLLI